MAALWPARLVARWTRLIPVAIVVYIIALEREAWPAGGWLQEASGGSWHAPDQARITR